MTEPVDRETARRVLALEMLGNAPGASTIREYLADLLWTLWTEKHFNAERPFGDSRWKNELYRPLVDAGLVAGRFDDYWHAVDVDEEAANRLILAAIEEMGQPG